MNLAALGLSPDNVRAALRKWGVRDFVDVAIKGWAFKTAAWWDEETHHCTGIHITDDPSRVLAKLRAGKDLDADASERELNQELGPGLYVSAAPQLWMNRSMGKWDFLKTLTRKQQRTLIRAVAAEVIRLHKERHYISESETERAIRALKSAWRMPDLTDAAMTQLAAQPYNIRLWHAEFLTPLGIRASGEPQQIEVEFTGRFAHMDYEFTANPKVYYALRKLGFDGAFLVGGFAGYPQTVIWTRYAVVRFGDHHIRP